MKNVTVVFTSGGGNWLGTELGDGAMLKQKIHQLCISAKGFPDPVADPEMKHVMGTDPRARVFLMQQEGAENWLCDQLSAIAERLEELQAEDESCILHVAVRCRGGFQRSVAIAEILAALLRKKLSDQPIMVAHLTLLLVLAVRQLHFGVNKGDSLSLDDTVHEV